MSGFNLVGKMLKGIADNAGRESSRNLATTISVGTAQSNLSPEELDAVQRAAAHFFSMKIEHDPRDGQDAEHAARILEEEGLTRDRAQQIAPELVSSVRNAVTDIARRVCAG